MRAPCIALAIVLSFCGLASFAHANPDAATESPLPRQFSVETKFIQLRGAPDWQLWTRPYPRVHQIDQGAGRVIGPIDATKFMNTPGNLDYRNLGFTSVQASALLSSPRVTQMVDKREWVKQGKMENKFKLVLTSSGALVPPDSAAPSSFLSSLESIIEIIQSTSLLHKPVTDEDYVGKAIIWDNRLEKDKTTAHPGGFLVMFEGTSTANASEFALDQAIIVRGTWIDHWEKSNARSTRLAIPLCVEIESSYTVADGSTWAFLVPVVGDRYLVAVTTFNLISASGSRYFR